jgi:hypothetical protein
MRPYWEKARWEETELGETLAYNFPAGISVYIVIWKRAYWDTLKVEKLNEDSSSCECRWIYPSREAAAESPIGSESTVKGSIGERTDIQCGVIALRLPTYIHEKKKRHYPPSFLFGRPTHGERFADVWFDGDTTTSRGEFVLEVKNGCYVLRSLNNSLVINKHVVVRAKEEAFALHQHEANSVMWVRDNQGQRERYQIF